MWSSVTGDANAHWLMTIVVGTFVGRCHKCRGSQSGLHLGMSFGGGKMVRGKCTLGRGLGPSPQESVIVPLSKHIYSSVSTGRHELFLSHYFKLHLGNIWGGSLSVWERSFPPPVD